MILDTDFLIYILRKKKEALQKLEELVNSPDNLYLTHINLCELYKGAYRSNDVQQSLSAIDNVLKSIDLLPFTKTVDRHFGRLYAESEKKGQSIGEMDTLIASIALDYGFAIVTGNVKHYQRQVYE
ncbi:MAG: type II toxin-antitoxin system VapC family toxin [Candidatus Hodarchaeales archaeon]